jgi:hypothetical protein
MAAAAVEALLVSEKPENPTVIVCVIHSWNPLYIVSSIVSSCCCP